EQLRQVLSKVSAAIGRRKRWTGNSSRAAEQRGNQMGSRHVRCHSQTDTAQQLNSLGNGVHKFRLFGEVLIEQKMKLVKSRTCHLPVRLFVEVAKSDRVGKQLV